MVTAFTLGHSITLILASLDIITFHIGYIEILITVSILLTCLKNYYSLFFQEKTTNSTLSNYILITAFGLIHGLGFSTFIKNMLFDGEHLITTILGFNLGIEAAQIIIVVMFLILITLLIKLTGHGKWFKAVINTIILILVIQLFF